MENRFGFVFSVRTFSIIYDHTFSKLTNHQIRNQATHKVGCQPGDCILHFSLSTGQDKGCLPNGWSMVVGDNPVIPPHLLCHCDYALTFSSEMIITID